MNTKTAISVTLVAWLLSACEINYGDQILGFVQRSGAEMSRQAAEAELHSQWAQAHSAQALALLSRLRLVEQWGETLVDAAKLELPAEGASEDQLVSSYRATQLHHRRLKQLATELDSALRAIDSWDSICSSREVFERTTLNRAGKLSRGFPRPLRDKDGLIGGGNDPGVIARVITSWFQDQKIDEQNQKVAEALVLADQVSVSTDDLFRLSETICRDEQAAHSTLRSGSRQSLESLRSALQSAHEGITGLLGKLEARIIPLRIRGREAILRAELTRQKSDLIAGVADRVMAFQSESRTLKRESAEWDDFTDRTRHFLMWSETRAMDLGLSQDPDLKLALDSLRKLP